MDGRLEAAKAMLGEIGKTYDLGLPVVLWDGSEIMLGKERRHPSLKLHIRDAGALPSLLRKPRLDTILRLHALGAIDLSGGTVLDLAPLRPKTKPKAVAKAIGLGRLLKPGGLYLHHAITRRGKRDEKAFRRKKPEYQAMTEYIFPGGEVDHIGHSATMLEEHGFEVHDVEGWRTHYARTTALWCRRLAARRDEAEALVGPERTRIWLAYLGGVSLGFSRGSISVFQTLASKRRREGHNLMDNVPLSRGDLYR